MTDVYIEPLTEGETEVLALLAEDLSNKEIANRLFKSVRTVEDYVRRLNAKLDTANRQEIVERAQSLGLLDEDQPEPTPLKTNLPHATTQFVGREADLDAIHDLLANPNTRLLTILAPGGMGKTRLAFEAAEQQLNNFPNGVYFVPLQHLSDAEHILPQIAASTGYQFTNDEREPKRQVLDFLSNKHMLLLLDNFEHLLDGVPLLIEILQAAPDVNLLVTSREKLNLNMETVYGLGGMAFPSWESPDDAPEYDAVQLLVSAAGRVNPDWQITSDNLGSVARACRLTQGMPLGILLAASWLDVFSLERICDEIQKSADILETNQHDMPKRQRSIRAVFETTWARLQPAEQSVFMQMSVFRGGCSPNAAEQLAGANPRILQALVNNALLMQTRDGRYDIHELLRQYAEEQLQISDLESAAHTAHANYFLTEVERAEPELTGENQIFWYDYLDAEYDNIRAAIQWFIMSQDVESEYRMIGALLWFWFYRKSSSEGYHWTERAMARDGDHISPFIHGKALNSAGAMAFTSNNHKLAADYHGRALALFRELDDKPQIAFTLLCVSSQLMGLGDFNAAIELCEEGLSLATALGDRVTGIQISNNLGNCLAMQGNMEASTRVLEEALLMARESQAMSDIAMLTHNLGTRALDAGDYAKARSLYTEALEVSQQVGTQHLIAIAITNLALVDMRMGKYDEALQTAEDALRAARNVDGFSSIVLALTIVSHINLRRNQLEHARAALMEAIVAFHGKDQQYILLVTVAQTAILSTALQHFDPAVRLFAAAFELPQEDYLCTPQEYERDLASLRQHLGDDSFEAAWSAGRAMHLDEALLLAKETLSLT